MKRPPVRLGPLALLLSVISICLAILAILTFSTARADLRLAEKTANTVSTRYALEEQGQRLLSELPSDKNAPLPAGWEAGADGSLSRTLENEGARLHIVLQPSEEGYVVAEWVHDREWASDGLLHGLWNGF
jgi:hypothetical protein